MLKMESSTGSKKIQSFSRKTPAFFVSSSNCMGKSKFHAIYENLRI